MNILNSKWMMQIASKCEKTIVSKCIFIEFDFIFRAFDATKSCFVSSIENCDKPTVKDMISSAFQIIRNETECANTIPVETNTLN